MTDWNHAHYMLSNLFDLPGYAGYKPEQREAPNGDGRVDHGKRYLHVALKYNPPGWALDYLARAHWEACKIAEAIGCPDSCYPRVENSTLRVIEYPADTGTVEHEDFDLFTLSLWRSTPDDYEYQSAATGEWRQGLEPMLFDPHGLPCAPCHVGQLGEAFGIGKSIRHRVPARPYAQRALAYFAMPAGRAILPEGRTVDEWLAYRYARSRVPAGY